MTTADALPWPDSFSPQGLRISNLASDLRIPGESGDALGNGAISLKDALQRWSVYAFARVPFMPKVRNEGERNTTISAIEQVGSENFLLPLMAFAEINESNRTSNEEELLAVAHEGIKPFLTILELLHSSEDHPSIYRLRTGEFALEYDINASRISCILDNKYCQILSSKEGEIVDQYFENDNYSVQVIRESFLKAVRATKEQAA